MGVSTRRALAISAGALAAVIVGSMGVVATARPPGALDDPTGALSHEQAQELVLKRVGPTAPPEKGAGLSTGPWVAGEPAPDLTPIDLENGTSGYLRVFDLAKPTSELESRQITEKTREFLLPVYAEDGFTVIGEFVVGTGTEE